VRLGDAARLLRTLRHLRAEQIVGQLRHRVVRHRPVSIPEEAPRRSFAAPAAPFLPPAPHARFDGGTIGLLNRSLPFALPMAWDGDVHGRLFAYHLHQLAWVRRPCDPALRAAVLEDWILRHRDGVGWEPDPVSLRALQWIRLTATPGALPDGDALRARLGRSLAQQLGTLERELEVHLLANHYLSNLLALTAAGLAFEGRAADGWLAYGDRLLAQLEAQVHPDGGHEERSPMYHALLLEGVLDVANLARSAPGRAPERLVRGVDAAAARMLRALAVWTHPDGRIALFADSAFGVAQEPADLARYAAALGLSAAPDEPAGVLADAGYVRLAAGPFTLLASVAGPLPAHQPGHAHCDALAFELSVGARRVVADTGVAEYVPGPQREASRATRSHATVQIDGEEQAELWGAHRIGGRPRVRLVAVDPGRAATAELVPWSRPGVRVERRFEVEAGEVRIRDRVAGATRSVALRLPLAPGLEPALRGAEASLPLGDGGVLEVALPAGAAWRQERAPYFPELGRADTRWCLVGESGALPEGVWRFRWRPA
jgi:uncharacterized heparinase superfamily protein